MLHPDATNGRILLKCQNNFQEINDSVTPDWYLQQIYLYLVRLYLQEGYTIPSIRADTKIGIANKFNFRDRPAPTNECPKFDKPQRYQ